MTTKHIDALKFDLIAWMSQIKDLDTIERILAIKKQTEQPLALPTPSKKTTGTYTYKDVVAIAEQYPEDKKWTYSELVRIFPANLKVKVEILNNKLLIMPSPSFIHQKISRILSNKMTNFAEERNLGEVLYAPMDTKFDENNVEQPDILFIAITRYDIIEENCINGAPDIVVEIISPANKKQERDDKHALYERTGVKEYWTVYPKKRTIKVETLEEGKFQLYSEGKKTGEICSKVLEGFSVKIEDIMPESLFEKKGEG
jgi:Uma2 family endonuclease